MKTDTWHITILSWFKKNPRGGLTAGEFARDTMSTKLSTRICELETLGHKFSRQWEVNTNTNARYIRYFYLGKQKDSV